VPFKFLLSVGELCVKNSNISAEGKGGGYRVIRLQLQGALEFLSTAL
jgi:hypothetical protein